MAKSPLPILFGGAAALLLLGGKRGSNGGGNGGGTKYTDLGRAMANTATGTPQNTTLSVAWNQLEPLSQNGLGSMQNPLVFPVSDAGDTLAIQGVPSKSWVFDSANEYMDFAEHYEPSFDDTTGTLLVTATTDGAPDFKVRKSGSGSQWIHVTTEN